jgi:hypothetical protein
MSIIARCYREPFGAPNSCKSGAGNPSCVHYLSLNREIFTQKLIPLGCFSLLLGKLSQEGTVADVDRPSGRNDLEWTKNIDSDFRPSASGTPTVYSYQR